jgi:hypothetical protein
MNERTKLILILSLLGLAWFLPLEQLALYAPLMEALQLVKWYAHEHVLLCLVPAFFIAGAIGLFVSQGSVMQFLGPQARKIVAYPVAAASGTVLAVCSCTVLPLFAGIHKRGAGLGPATAFLYSGPAINVLAIVMTAQVLGFELGVARAVGAILFSIVIGLLMHLIFRRTERQRVSDTPLAMPTVTTGRKPWQSLLFFGALIGILIFANWSKPQGDTTGIWSLLYDTRWFITAAFLLLLVSTLRIWFKRDELTDWTLESWGFAKQILPLLFAGVLVAGFLLGGPEGGRGVIPDEWISSLVGGNTLTANFFASLAGALMYFATLTEVPILEGLLNGGMGKGPALALLLAGPAVSLPNMLVIRTVLGTRQTLVFIGLVVILSTLAGYMYGWLF